VEAEAVQIVFFPDGENPFDEQLIVGSIKTVIGHLEGTAGIAGLLKASLAIKHGIIPPNMHFNQLNPNVAPFYDHLCVPTKPTPWAVLPEGVPRRASVNSFGIGGTNAHVILESWNPVGQQQGYSKIHCGPFNLLANSNQALISTAAALSNTLKTQDNLSLADLAYTMTRRTQFQFNASFSATSRDQLIEKLDEAVQKSSFGRRR